MPRITPLALALSSLLAATPALAQQADKDARTLDTLIVTGTRVADRTVAESQSPIDILTPETLEATGTTELATALARALPSLNFPRPGMADGTSGVRPAQLRGLSPDQVLILVNGKRRHISALVNVNGTIGRGSSAVDLNTIPVAAIERVEVLRDGASAQYGSDAIGGVVNIVLKGSGEGGSIALGGGQYSEGDGKQWQLSGDTGLTLSGDAGTIHVAAQAGHQDMTNRAGPYQGSAPNTGNFPDVGQTAFKLGDPDVDQSALSFNANLNIGENNLYRQRDVQRTRHHLVRVLPLEEPQRPGRPAGAGLPGRLRAGDQPGRARPQRGGGPEGRERERLELGPELQPRRQPAGLPHPEHHQLRASAPPARAASTMAHCSTPSRW